ncbi:serine/arginine-rich splicing factor 5 isoform X2 [Hyalella azteca]|uniref:Serine/arginine-rich splicing factor 5 isoform X2 n=1 Tax=Hyalella azteca TaxID=294128 RepID=A0A979FPK7_HYAAZ|nr:serine/arginine-rich splicing factor 5 isoform X2 [Hyalella azteca]
MTRIYVGGIPSDCREKDLDRFFRNYGRLRDCLIKNGYAFVEFEDSRDADDAVYEMNGRELLGARVSVEHARGVPRRGEVYRDRRPPPSSWSDRSRPAARGLGGGYGPPPDARYGPPMRTPYRVLVENLSSRISWQDLKDYMRKEADVTFADAHRHARNVGIVEFASYSDMQRAIDRLDDTELMGRRIKLIDDYNRGSRSRSRRRRSRTRSRSRSGSRRRRSYSSSRSRSRSRRRSRSRSRSRSRKNTKRSSRSRSRSRSRSKDSAKRSHSKSKSPEKEGSKSRSRSPTKESPEKSTNSANQNGKRAHSHSKSRSKSRSAEHSPSPKKARQSRSRSRSVSRSRSRSGGRDYDDRSRSRSRSRTRSRSPAERNGDE